MIGTEPPSYFYIILSAGLVISLAGVLAGVIVPLALDRRNGARLFVEAEVNRRGSQDVLIVCARNIGRADVQAVGLRLCWLKWGSFGPFVRRRDAGEELSHESLPSTVKAGHEFSWTFEMDDLPPKSREALADKACERIEIRTALGKATAKVRYRS